ncbi:C45 family autoproteolytic acyltransferase/hydolase [Streptomyces ochraceiscleroticus]|uniref:C45 family autoproteolytic acyltransferase/hydrolase n=1 Tax=Streptomyces ochraceiscleroticus TaxID=47761 RepID=A0ABW1MU25_9ACTN|nr:C45 family peptidase [Streptomyces ochraceiscleroticus]
MTPGAGIPFIRASGGPFAAGRAHGEALAGPLRAFLDDSLARLNKVMPEPVSLDGLLPSIAAYQAAVAAATPELAEEVAGLAAGAGITPDEAWLLQLRREIMGYRKVPTAGDCTTYARTGAAGPVLAQTVDLNGNLDDYLGVLEVARTGSPRRSLVLSFGGLLGYLGLNSDGLAVGLNLVLGGDWHPGVPPYLAIRHLLDTARDVPQALEILRGLPLASSRTLVLCDRERVAVVEILGDELRVTEGAETAHTNHFLHPDFVPFDEINVFARNSSVRRLKAATAGLAELPPGCGAEDHFRLLSQPPICVPDRGDIRGERTVAAVVMLPSRGELHVRPGDPSLSSTQVFRL